MEQKIEVLDILIQIIIIMGRLILTAWPDLGKRRGCQRRLNHGGSGVTTVSR